MLNGNPGSEPVPGKVSRRDFLKILKTGAQAVAVGTALSACGVKPGSPEVSTPSPTVPATPERPNASSDLILVGREDEEIWQVKVDSTLSQAVESIAPWEQWQGFGLTWVKDGGKEAVLFSGDSRKKNPYKLSGKNVLIAIDNLADQGGKLDDLPQINPRTCQAGEKAIVGVSSIVEQNLNALIKPDGPLASLQAYYNVIIGYDEATKKQQINITKIQRLSPGDQDYSQGMKEWQATPLKQFTADLGGNWQ